MNTRLLKLLRKIRKSLEQMAENHPLFFQKDLGCMCAISSWFVSYKLRELGYDVQTIDGYYDGDSHCWTVLNGKIIDLTLTQFKSKAPKIYIAEKDTDYIFYREIRTVKDLQLWPNEQKPIKKTVGELEAIYGGIK